VSTLAPPRWKSWPPEAKEQLLTRLRERVRGSWDEIARPEQLPPAWNWFVWLILAGRGWGKTRTGAEWAAQKARDYPGCRIALVAQTFSDGRDTMVEGESGLLSVLSPSELRGGSVDSAWNRSLGELFLENGSRFKVFTSEKPRRLRGPQHHFAWGDEPATWLDAHVGPAQETTWSMLVLGCRLTTGGSRPQVVLTGTPKPVRLLVQKDKDALGLIHRKSTAVTRGHTDENLENLAPSYRTEVIDPLRDTRLGRQELAAEILEDVEGALWRRAWVEEFRVQGEPQKGYRVKVLALDPADGGEAGAAQAWCVAGQGLDRKLYVKESEGMRTSPLEWLRAAVRKARDEGATILVEKNHGGKFLIELLEQAMVAEGVRVPFMEITASEGKTTRAEPVAMLYEQAFNQGKAIVRHIGQHTELEDQLVSWTGDPKEKSPDRLDALVWALKHLMGYSRGPSSGEAGAVPYRDSNGRKVQGGAVAYR
jgi:predicted phage terminase large subunit-like protein